MDKPKRMITVGILQPTIGFYENPEIYAIVTGIPLETIKSIGKKVKKHGD